MRHAVIMAGGSGTRLWPLSRRMRPKQLMRLFDGASLLQLARRRLAGLFEARNTWIITSAAYIDLVAAELPDIPRENLIGEPMGRDTANAVGLAAQLIARRDPEATMSVFTADHVLTPQVAFESSIRSGLCAAEEFPSSLVTFGVTPDAPHTGYGYVRRGTVVGTNVYRCAGFKEKPTLDIARHYLASGDYLWNSGMFCWRTKTILREFARHLPENHARLEDIAQRWEKLERTDELSVLFGGLQKISVDYGILERAQDVMIVEMACRWLDVGSWTAIASTRSPDAQENIAVGARAITQDAARNILVSESDHLLVALGVSDLIIVHSPDATLVCHREHEQQIKNLVQLREAKFGVQYE